MRISDFDLYKELLQKESGLRLTPDQSYLLDSRLTPIAKKWGYATLGAMTLSLRGVPSPDLIRDIVEAMNFRETAFFFESLSCAAFRETVLPYLAKKRKKQQPLRIWSAACGTGQEAYSLAMSVLETLPDRETEILATDISGPFLTDAENAEYTQVEMQRGLPVKMLLKYGTHTGINWKINDNVRELVNFRQFNLLDDMDPLGDFDVIFCRHVLPYLEEEAQKDILSRLATRLPEDGFLFLGESESLPGKSDFRELGNIPGLYVPGNGPHKEETLVKIAAQ